MTQPLKLTVLGAGGATGRQIVSQALSRGHHIRAVERSWKRPPDWGTSIDLVTADVLADDLGPVVDGRDAVISALGLSMSPSTAIDPPPLYSEGTLRIVRAMQAAGVRRLVVISATFVATRDRGPVWFRAASRAGLGRVFAQMAEMERLLRASDNVDWTAVRPGWLMDGPLTTDYVVAPDVIAPGTIRTRHADLAHFMLTCVEDGAWIHGTPAIARAEPASASGPDKLVREVLGF